MEVTVLLFGPAASVMNADRVTVQLKAEPTVMDVQSELSSKYPGLLPALAVGRFALNHRFAASGATVRPDDEVALISMVSGG